MSLDSLQRQNFSQFKNCVSQQNHHTSIGNPFALFLADLFMDTFELETSQNLGYFPKIRLSHRNDIFTICDSK